MQDSIGLFKYSRTIKNAFRQHKNVCAVENYGDWMSDTMDESKHSLLKKSTIIFCALAIAGVLAVLISVSIARSVNVSEFGIYSIVVSIQGMVVIVAGFSIGPALAKYIAEYRVDDRDKALAIAKVGVRLAALFSLLTCAVYCCFAGLLGNGLYQEPRIVALIPLSALAVFSNAMYATTYGIVQGCQQMRLLGTMQVFVPFITLMSLPILLPSFGLGGVFSAYALSQTTITLSAWHVLRKKDFPFLQATISKTHSSHSRKILGFAFPGVLSSMMLGPVMWVANTELTLTVGFEAMGYFGVAFVFYQAIRVIPRSIVIPLIPRISELSAKHAFPEIERVVVNAIRLLSVSMFPLMYGLAIFSGRIIDLLYGEYYVPASEVMYLLVSATYFYTLASVIGALISGTGRMWIAFVLNGIWACTFIALVFVSVPLWGLLGMGVAFACSYAIHMATSYFTSYRALGVRLNRAYVTTLLSAGMFGFGYLWIIWASHGGLETQILVFLMGSAVIIVEGRSAVRSVIERLLVALRSFL